MKVLTILGSPRKIGNCASISQEIMKAAESKGAEIELCYLQSLKYSGCIACNGCKTSSEKCVLKDDLTEILKKTEEADVLIFASPIYFGDITGQLKCYIDRLYSFFTPDFHTSDKPSRLKSGKKLIFVLAQGQPNEDMFNDVYPRYEMFLKWFGFECSLIRAVGVRERDDAVSDSVLMSKAKAIGESLCK